jgi:hypothetical protein
MRPESPTECAFPVRAALEIRLRKVGRDTSHHCRKVIWCGDLQSGKFDRANSPKECALFVRADFGVLAMKYAQETEGG